MPAPRKYPDELRRRAVKLYRKSDPKPVVRRLAEQLGVHPEALRTGSARTKPTPANVMTGPRPRPSKRTADCAKRSLSCAEPTRSSKQRAFFRPGGRPSPAAVMKIVADLRDRFRGRADTPGPRCRAVDVLRLAGPPGRTR